MIPKDPGDINNSQQGWLELAEHFFRQKMLERKREGRDPEDPGEGLEGKGGPGPKAT